MSDVPVITVDGPSGAGKGTISHMLAEALGWHLLDSGALYRVTGQACLIEGVGWDDHAGGHVAELARHLEVSVFQPQPVVRFWCPIKALMSVAPYAPKKVGAAPPPWRLFPAVRDALLQRQREFLQPPDWWPMVAIWAPWCFPPHPSNFSLPPVPRSAPSGAISS